jgi:hypothetical protein
MVQRLSKEELFRIRNHIPINDVIVRVLDLPSKTRDGYLRFLCPICSEFMTACNPKTNLARFIIDTGARDFKVGLLLSTNPDSPQGISNFSDVVPGETT